jgi:CBS domain-containing protein
MIRYNIHHLLVIAQGELKGVITNHDLMIFQGSAPLSIAREIENQTSVDGLVPVARKINRIIEILVRDGAQAGNINRIITEVNDRLLRKLLELTEKRMGAPPVSYCWIVFGSEGRKEQTFKTDQDNAIIYQDPPEVVRDEANRYFSAFSHSMSEALAQSGFPRCSAGYMASNPTWCQPLSVWKGYFLDWIYNPTPEAILQSLIFFDFRPVHGNVLLAETLRAHMAQRLKKQNIFFAHMAAVILANRPPLGFLKRFVLEKKGEHKNTFNIKFNGLCPVVDAARLAALELGVYSTSTMERLREVKESQSPIANVCGDLEQAFEFLMSLRLRHQYEQMQKGASPDNFINPFSLSTMDRRSLLESFGILFRTQDAIKSQYGSWMTM